MSISRNDPCPCGSSKKYKKCCLRQKEKDFDAEEPFWAQEGVRDREPDIKPMGFVLAKMADRIDEMELLPQVARDYIKKNSWTPTKVRALSTTEIISELENRGVHFDQPQFETGITRVA